ncbi:YugN family protein [Alkalihalobacillus sp. AL-G]|uniref:YugN family protein n=1 Tax=Alkalihalobacillus sp. AL-G TaxID=2926399 RepID=UPI00272BB42B|nr:YugN family protein [Alkalihalobacillus sp. AL-G]WLD95375.1 YugN-like family protein [Alkalihalobacillus sp. AL-G]
MKFEEISLAGKVLNFELLEHLMHDVGLVRAGQWDYERITYDYKFENMDNGEIYYLRVPCYAVEGEVESPHALIKIMEPYLGKHYYPHGVEYDEDFPKSIVDSCKKILNQLKEEIEKHHSE